MNTGRLIVVSNRLPITLEETAEGWVGKPSSGGLATAMDPILNEHGGTWIGWPGEHGSLSLPECERLLNIEGAPRRYRPIDTEGLSFLDFYEGYPNKTVWPLFHYFPSQMQFQPGSWEAYVEGNRRFCEAVEQDYQPGDLIWVHDYHLMLLPAMLREKLPGAKIGFFLHIPFPSSELFSNLPRREEVLIGLLGADLIAFHTHRHVHHFRSSLLRVLSLESAIHQVEYASRLVQLEAMPIGIAPEQFIRLIHEDNETARHHADLKQRFLGQRIIAAVDRMDYTKGLVQRLRTFRWLLQTQPSLAGTVVLVQIAVPSREGIGLYQELGEEVNQLVSEINGKSGTAGWTPVVYINRGIPPAELAALYLAADVAWVTPLRDGMNLVAKEYCACKPEGDGVLMLSEFAGAAAELGEALLVNPYDEERVGETLLRALAMPQPERRRRMQALHRRVLRQNVFTWAQNFISVLQSHSIGTSIPELTGGPELSECATKFARAERPLLMLDYDGTLVPLAAFPEQAAPDATVLKLLRDLASDSRVCTAVISGRKGEDLEKWLGTIPGLILAAEHGSCIRMGPSQPWTYLKPLPDSSKWKDQVRPVLEHFVDRTPGSFLEEKELALVWHYRNAEPEFAEWLASEMVALLEGLLADSDVHPVRGHKIVEVRPNWVNKGEFATWLNGREPDADFRLALGDDRTDEDMFAQMPEGSATIRVGPGDTRAVYRVRDSGAVRRLLETMIEQRTKHHDGQGEGSED
jgi:trehalose 6-phosphate synthase/phosphatase